MKRTLFSRRCLKRVLRTCDAKIRDFRWMLRIEFLFKLWLIWICRTAIITRHACTSFNDVLWPSRMNQSDSSCSEVKTVKTCEYSSKVSRGLNSTATLRYVPAEDIPNDIVIVYRNVGSPDWLPPCPLNNSGKLPSIPLKPWKYKTWNLDWLPSRFNIATGGHGFPSSACRPQVKVAIIVPYRDRAQELPAFLWYMHQFLSMQYLDYIIIVVEQSPKFPFNKGRLFNAGFLEALAMDDQLDCFIFHDVDMLPENLLNTYGCSEQPRHLVTVLNNFRYTLPYVDIFGGAVAMRKHQFVNIRGFSNRFFGWGGEDDDLAERVLAKNYTINRWDPAVARYTMMVHKKEAKNLTSDPLLKEAKEHFVNDGLPNLQYRRLKLVKRPLYTWIYIDL